MLVSSLNCYGSGYCLFNEHSGLGGICPVKIAKRDDRAPWELRILKPEWKTAHRSPFALLQLGTSLAVSPFSWAWAAPTAPQIK
jgi:hypothetical protein